MFFCVEKIWKNGIPDAEALETTGSTQKSIVSRASISVEPEYILFRNIC
jgi:hypothetical protein